MMQSKLKNVIISFNAADDAAPATNASAYRARVYTSNHIFVRMVSISN